MRTLFALALAAASVIPAVAQTSAPRQASEFAINMPDGSQKLLSSYKGKPVCLAFFFTTCPHCQDMAKLLSSEIEPEYGPKGVQILAAAFDDNAKSQVADFPASSSRASPWGTPTVVPFSSSCRNRS